ncbi:metallophosphoesterase [Flavitalea flava]
MRRFVMGDIHGAYKALIQCLERSGFDKTTDELIQLGDVCDGFNEVYACVEELISIPNLIAIKGNHDEWFHDFIETGYHSDKWRQGGRATAQSYLRVIGKEDMIIPSGEGYATVLNSADVPEEHQRFFRRQALYYIDEQNNCFVHGGFNRQQEFRGQPSLVYLWDRNLWSQALSFGSYKKNKCSKGRFKMVTEFKDIFIGHTATTYWGTDQPMDAANIHNLDTGGGGGGRLTIMDLDTKEFWQSDPVGEMYKFR